MGLAPFCLQAVPVPDASSYPSEAEIQMPPPPVVSVVIGDSATPPQRLDTRNTKTQTDTDGPSVVEDLKKLASWLADRQQDNMPDDNEANSPEESNRYVPASSSPYSAAAATAGVPNSLAVGGEPAASTERGTDTRLGMGETAALGESKGAADLA